MKISKRYSFYKVLKLVQNFPPNGPHFLKFEFLIFSVLFSKIANSPFYSLGLHVGKKLSATGAL